MYIWWCDSSWWTSHGVHDIVNMTKTMIMGWDRGFAHVNRHTTAVHTAPTAVHTHIHACTQRDITMIAVKIYHHTNTRSCASSVGSVPVSMPWRSGHHPKYTRIPRIQQDPAYKGILQGLMGNMGTIRENAHIIIWTDNIMVPS